MRILQAKRHMQFEYQLQKYKLRQKGLGERSWDRMKSDFVLER